MGALGLFLAASIGASLATGAPMLIGFRVLQGLGGGLMLPVLQTLLVQAAAGRPLGRVTALISLPVLLGPVLGPVAGGLIVQHLSRRWIFWVNVPFGVAGLILAGLLLAPQGVGVLLSRGLAGHLSDRFGGRWVAFAGTGPVGRAAREHHHAYRAAVVLERTGDFTVAFWWAIGSTGLAMLIALWLPARTRAPAQAPQ